MNALKSAETLNVVAGSGYMKCHTITTSVFIHGPQLQTMKAFEAALHALVGAGVELVEFDMGLLTAEGAEIEAELLLAYEMPREVSRSVAMSMQVRCNV